MKSVTCTNGKLDVVDLPTPTPAKGQLLIEVLRCGICGSDLHARHHCDELADVMAESGYDAFMRSWDNTPEVGGVIWWEWTAYGSGKDCYHYTPKGKPAEKLLRDWFAKKCGPGLRIEHDSARAQ